MTHEVIQQLTEIREDEDYTLFGYICSLRKEAKGNFCLESGISIRKGDICYVIHTTGGNMDSNLSSALGEIRGELGKIAQEIEKYELSKVHIVGFAIPSIARIAFRLGFSTHEIDVPSSYKKSAIKGFVESKYTRTNSGATITTTPFLMCYQSGIVFAQRFGTGLMTEKTSPSED